MLHRTIKCLLIGLLYGSIYWLIREVKDLKATLHRQEYEMGMIRTVIMKSHEQMSGKLELMHADLERIENDANAQINKLTEKLDTHIH